MLGIDPDRILSITNGNQSLSVLFALAQGMDINNISTLSVEELSTMTGLCRQTVSKHLNKLKSVEAIKIMRSDIDGRVNIYEVNIEWVSI